MQPLDRRGMRWALALTVASAAGVVVLAARIHRSGAPFWLDAGGQRVAFAHLLGMPLVPSRVAHVVVSLGDTTSFAVMVAVVVAAALALRDRMSAAVALAACPLALLATEVIGKPLVGRRESWSSGFGFPSGHATAVATVVALVALLAYRRGQVRGLVAIAPIALLVPAMALALVRSDFHLFSDTVAGALVGMGTVLGLSWLASLLVGARANLNQGDRPARSR